MSALIKIIIIFLVFFLITLEDFKTLANSTTLPILVAQNVIKITNQSENTKTLNPNFPVTKDSQCSKENLYYHKKVLIVYYENNGGQNLPNSSANFQKREPEMSIEKNLLDWAAVCRSVGFIEKCRILEKVFGKDKATNISFFNALVNLKGVQKINLGSQCNRVDLNNLKGKGEKLGGKLVQDRAAMYTKKYIAVMENLLYVYFFVVFAIALFFLYPILLDNFDNAKKFIVDHIRRFFGRQPNVESSTSGQPLNQIASV